MATAVIGAIGFFISFSSGEHRASTAALGPMNVNASPQHFYFNSVRIGNSQPPASEFFGTGDIIISRRTFASQVIAGGMTDTSGQVAPGTIRLRDEMGRDLLRASVGSSQGAALELKSAEGNATVQINGGASGGSITLNGRGLDYAEVFDLREKATLEPGHVVVIDPDKPGRLKLSTRSYDRGVAGIIAGADGLHSGIVLGSGGPTDKPVALGGRVYCWVDAAYGNIQPGDLLTTSPTPGHAMAVRDPAQAQGAILGKAMQAWHGGRGRILVLVSLQ
jgi:hypothetical protein